MIELKNGKSELTKNCPEGVLVDNTSIFFVPAPKENVSLFFNFFDCIYNNYGPILAYSRILGEQSLCKISFG